MAKDALSQLTVKRISSSPYFSEEFGNLEEKTIMNLTGAKMLPSDSLGPASVLITNTHTHLASITDLQLKKCQLMIHPNSGYDNFSKEFVSTVHFPIVIGNPIRENAVANFIISALFSHYSFIPTHTTWNLSRKWPRKLLSELTILIMGYGHIGTILNKVLSPLASSVRIYDPYAGFPELDLQNIDVLIPVCSLNSKNYHFINKDILQQLNNDFLFINAARGSLVNTIDLISVLNEKSAAFAVLDVFEKEPADFNLFVHLENIKLSSHIAGVYKNIDLETANFEAKIIFDFIHYETSKFSKKYKNILLRNRILDQELI